MPSLSSSLSIQPREGGAQKDAGGIRQWRHSNNISRVICFLLLLSVFVFFEDYFIISDSLVPNIEVTATISRNETTSAVLLPSSAPTSNATATAFPDKRHVDADADLGDHQDEERKSSDDEDSTVQTDDIGSSSWIDPYEEQPGCLLLIQLARAGTPKHKLSMRKILKTFGKYVPVASLSSSSSSGEDIGQEGSVHGPRYDHRSCFLMRPRYNCARNDQNATTNNGNSSHVATDFAMVLETPMKTTTGTALSNHSSNDTEDYDLSSSTVCDLQKFVHDAGGPAGIGRRMLQNYQKTTDIVATANDDEDEDKDNASEPTEDPIVEVLLVGTSRFRQIFEALVCGFSDQMTDLRLQLGGPVFNKDHKFMNAEEMGPLVDLEFLKNGSCYLPEAQADYSEFFRKDGTVVPSNHDRCNDNIGMVEFSIGAKINDNATSTTTTSSGGRIRFYNVFRPWAWTNVSPALEALGIEKKHKLDFVLWEPRDEADEPSWQYSSSSNLKSLYKNIFDIHTTTITTENNSTAANDVSASNIEQHDAHELYKEIQVRDTGRYFGADNPWITNPPDEEHPCMPGMPDDKVNFLLWYMLSLSAIEEPNS